MKQILSIKHIIEKNIFGVCSFLGEKMSIQTSRVRLYFIYLTFATLGSSILIYLFMAFWINLKKYIRKSENLMMD
jgi:phage shock protein PspC (stress-responsive transcriptional regulator)